MAWNASVAVNIMVSNQNIFTDNSINTVCGVHSAAQHITNTIENISRARVSVFSVQTFQIFPYLFYFIHISCVYRNEISCFWRERILFHILEEFHLSSSSMRTWNTRAARDELTKSLGKWLKSSESFSWTYFISRVVILFPFLCAWFDNIFHRFLVKLFDVRIPICKAIRLEMVVFNC